jgi:hypothetical protein
MPLPPPILAHLRLLADACGRTPAAPDAPLWGRLFALPPPSTLTGLPPAALEDALEEYYGALGEGGMVVGWEAWSGGGEERQGAPPPRPGRPGKTFHPPPPSPRTSRAVANADRTRNFDSLLRATAVAVREAAEATGPHPATAAAARRAADAAALARALVKLASHRLDARRLAAVAGGGGADALAGAALAALGAKGWRRPLDAPSYALHVELCHVLLALASSVLYTPPGGGPPPAGAHPLADALARPRADAGPALAGLMAHIVGRQTPPAGAGVGRAAPTEVGAGPPRPPPGRAVRLLRAAVAAVAAARRAAASLLSRPAIEGERGPLADAARAAALVLLAARAPARGAAPPYASALAALMPDDAGTDAASVEAPPPLASRPSAGGAAPPAAAPLAALASALAAGAGGDADALLLYFLLHGCPAFKAHVLGGSGAGSVAVALPLLRALHAASPARAPRAGALGAPPPPRPPPARTYMLLVDLLLLTQEPAFCEAAKARVSARDASFYVEASLRAPSAAALATAVLIGAAHAALGRGGRDVYQLTTALAAAANLAPAAAPLPPHVGSRLVRLVERLAARHARLAAAGDPEARVMEDLTRVGLEVVAAAAAAALAPVGGGGRGAAPPKPAPDPAAADLVYALLHRADAFALLTAHPRFSDLAGNVAAVTAFFGGRVDAAAAGAPEALSAGEVMDALRAALPDWPAGGLAPLPDLSFAYEEEADAADFFLPAAWGAALRATGGRCGWPLGAVALFPAAPSLPPSADGGGGPGLDLADAAALASAASVDGGAAVESAV